MASQSSLATGGMVARKGSRADPSTSGKLGEAWEDDRQIRARLRDNEGKLVKWAKPELTNKGTMSNIALNSRALKHLAAWWCPQVKSAKSPSVLDVKQEAILKQNRFKIKAFIPHYSAHGSADKGAEF